MMRDARFDRSIPLSLPSIAVVLCERQSQLFWVACGVSVRDLFSYHHKCRNAARQMLGWRHNRRYVTKHGGITKMVGTKNQNDEDKKLQTL